jgi:hypothetical protein
MNRTAPLIILLSILVFSCFEEDQPVPPYGGEVTTISDSVQTHQSYFDFETGRVTASHRSDAWQLGFECGKDGWHIITNSGSNWFIYNTRQTLLDYNTTMPGSVDNLYDVQPAYPDSTAVGNWVSFQEDSPVYTRNIYLLGHFAGNSFTDIRQLVFLEVNDNTYRFFYKEPGLADTVTILKNDTVNFMYYSFASHTQVNLEPDKTTYDLVFSPYYDLATLFGMTIPYQVGGTLLNTFQTEAVLDSVRTFEDINNTVLPEYTFVNRRDMPGYRWKSVTVDISGGGVATYAVKVHYNYVFHTAQDNYFKLKFLSYTLNGKSGFPQFEFRPLE